MDDFSNLKAIREKKDLEKDKKYKEESRERLKKICETKVKTTMIGAISSIEEKFSKYYTSSGRPSNEELILRKIYDEIRTEILDKGNQQIRNLDTEFEQYTIHWNRYQLNLPVRQVGK